MLLYLLYLTLQKLLRLNVDENQSTKDNSDSGGCETLETPNIFMFPSVLSFITILIRSCFYFRKIYSPSQSRSYFI